MSKAQILTGLGYGFLLLTIVGAVRAEDGAGGPQTYPLWPEGVPGAKGDDPDLDVPTLTVYRPGPEAATGAAVVICPGGGYRNLALDHEGKQVAEWLNRLGVTAVVLKYRLGPRYHHPAMLQDGARAIRIVRARAEEWGIDPNRIAILGFSAGGHLASTVGTHWEEGRPDSSDVIERVSSRPDRMILVYPVISLDTPYAHVSSRQHLLGEDPPHELVASLSNETRVNSETPPSFLVHSSGDTSVPAENSILFVLALRKAKVPVEFHLFEKGAHGLGLGGGRTGKEGGDLAFKVWPDLCERWLKGQGFLSK